MITFSVIVPVYNIAALLPECLNGVLAAVSEKDEILLSLGDSTDGSNELAGRYADEYANIHTLWQKGSGLADARNSAMELARGDYLLFVDGDDRVYPDRLRQLLAGIREGAYAAEVIMTDYYVDNDAETRLLRQIGERRLRGLNALPEVICKTSAFWTVWRNIYQKNFLDKNRLFFRETEFNEDADFIARLLTAQPDILFLDQPFYRYRQGREGSLMNARALLRMRQNEEIFRESIALLRDDSCAWKRAAVTGYQYGYVMNMALLWEVTPAERKRGKRVFRRWREALSPSTDAGVRAFACLLHTAGIGCASRILHRLKQRKRKREGRKL